LSFFLNVEPDYAVVVVVAAACVLFGIDNLLPNEKEARIDLRSRYRKTL
jgi:hypothetical protein